MTNIQQLLQSQETSCPKRGCFHCIAMLCIYTKTFWSPELLKTIQSSFPLSKRSFNGNYPLYENSCS